MKDQTNSHLPVTRLLYRLWRHIGKRRQRQFCLLLGLMVLTAFAEIISIGAVLPFLGVLTAPERIFEISAIRPIIHVLALDTQEKLLLFLTMAFGISALVAGSMRLFLLWASTRLSFATGTDVSSNIYLRTLYQSYSVHVARNSSEIIDGITGKSNSVINNTIVPALTLIGSSVMIFAILTVLISIEPFIALISFGFFGLLYALIIRLTRKRLWINSKTNARDSTNVIKSLQEGLGGIRDVLIDGTQTTYCQIYRSADLPMRRAQASSTFIGVSPRYAMEAFGMVLIAGVAYYLAQQPDGLVKAIPILGTLAVAAQRLLPALQQAYSGWASIQSGRASLQETLELLDQPLPEYANQPMARPISFQQNIRLRHLSFKYSNEKPWIIRNLELKIVKGSRVGFIGKTGSGKSTLIDIVMGLLQPSEGVIEIDGRPICSSNCRSWQVHIAHVPQSIYLSDSTIEENIAFGISAKKIDHERVRRAAQRAQIADIIETWPLKYKTFVGERGIRLSGGQRQRIGIARALYKEADVIIFDEATSALDNTTEKAVMQAIEGLSKDLTVLIIAHRLTTLKNCTQIFELDGGNIKRTGSYQDIIAQLK